MSGTSSSNPGAVAGASAAAALPLLLLAGAAASASPSPRSVPLSAVLNAAATLQCSQKSHCLRRSVSPGSHESEVLTEIIGHGTGWDVGSTTAAAQGQY